ncbi:hypothetical protein AB205_0037360 [Aquarana catesbeiana]|uniref:Uncharacterized protein n=1 Tax=Aquarana catesbeiana TaxID=8400 RepID=A0A2G9SN93_AQUCT|nr:hypothetical protein AB205_0037360 [Aquarana catesbeiana]
MKDDPIKVIEVWEEEAPGCRTEKIWRVALWGQTGCTAKIARQLHFRCTASAIHSQRHPNAPW